MHAPPQFSLPAGHDVPHAPAEQTSPIGQAWLQAPQCTGLDNVSMQAPSHATKPIRQLKPHSPPLQFGTPLAGASQAVPQAPQFATSPLVSTHVPSEHAL
jgi:hypothetical protein